MMNQLYQNSRVWQAFLGIVDQTGRDYRAAVCLLECNRTGQHGEGQDLTGRQD